MNKGVMNGDNGALEIMGRRVVNNTLALLS